MYWSYQRLSASIQCIRRYSMLKNKSVMLDVSNCYSHYRICLNYSTKGGGEGRGGGGGKVTPFKLADIGEGIAEVELMKWFIKEGKLTIITVQYLLLNYRMIGCR
jgi:hypothetical protein